MGVKEIGTNKYKVSFTQGYREDIHVGQNETGKVLNFLITDENNQVVDTENYTFEMLIVSRWGKYTLEGLRQSDNSFNILITPESVQHWETNAKYQLFLTDSEGTVLSKTGTIQIYRDNRIDDENDINIVLDYEEVKKTIILLDEYVERGEEVLEKAIKVKTEVLTLQEDVSKIKIDYVDIKEKLTNINNTADYLNENISIIDRNVKDSKTNADVALSSMEKSKEIRVSMENIFETEQSRQTAHEQRTTTFNSWFDIFENATTGWKAIFSGWKSTIEEWFSKLIGFEENEQERVSAENTRISSEENRILSFKSWALQFQDFIQNDANHKYNETQRTEVFNKIVTDWEAIKNELSDGDIGEIVLELSKLRDTTSKHIKLLNINSADNTLEAWLEKDIDVPSFILSLPKGFSGSYNDLTNKPNLFSGKYSDLTDKPTLFSGSYDDLADKPTNESYSNANYKIERFGNFVNLLVKKNTTIANMKTWTLPEEYRPSVDTCTSVTFWRDTNTIWILYVNVLTTGKLIPYIWVRSYASKDINSEAMHSTDRTIEFNVSMSYQV